MEKNNFGIKGILQHYSFIDYLKDIIIPFLFAVAIVLFAIYKKYDSLRLLVNVIDIALDIVPALFSLLLTAYLFLLTFMQTEKLRVLFSSDKGKQLLLQLNSSFALCVLTSAISLALVMVIYFVVKLEFLCVYADLINYFTIFIVSILLGFLIKIQFSIVIDLYNCGQATFYM